MSNILGYVIVGPDGKLFAGYKHLGTQRTGNPVWVKNLENANYDGGKAAIYPDLKTAADVALSIFSRDQIRCGARGVVLAD